MKTPTALTLYCETCGEETLHKILKGKIKDQKGMVIDIVAKCNECDSTYTGTVRAPKLRTIPLILSHGEESRKTSIDLPENERIYVEDELILDTDIIMITSIEARGRRLKSAQVDEIETLWAKLFNTVQVPVSVNRGARTITGRLEAVPDEEFYIGDTVNLRNLPCVIHQIMLVDGRMVRRGGAPAREIKRVYGKVIRAHTSY